MFFLFIYVDLPGKPRQLSVNQSSPVSHHSHTFNMLYMHSLIHIVRIVHIVHIVIYLSRRPRTTDSGVVLGLPIKVPHTVQHLELHQQVFLPRNNKFHIWPEVVLIVQVQGSELWRIVCCIFPPEGRYMRVEEMLGFTTNVPSDIFAAWAKWNKSPLVWKTTRWHLGKAEPTPPLLPSRLICIIKLM